MGEAVSTQNTKVMESTDSFINNRLKRKTMNGSTELAQKADSCTLSRLGAKCTQLALETEMVDEEAGRNVPPEVHELRQTGRSLFATLDSDGYRVFLGPIRPYVTDCGEYFNVSIQKLICMPKYPYVSSCRVPTLQDEVCNGFTEISYDGKRVVQRVVTSKSFYGSQQRRFTSTLVTGKRRVESEAIVESS